MGFYAILWEEWINWKKRFLLYLGMYMLSPLLFLITFGWGSGRLEYLHFLLPGIMAFSALLNCYNGVANRILASKRMANTFEYYLQAPLSPFVLTLGYALSGALRGFFAVCLILVVGLLLKVKLVLSLSFFLTLFLICFTFSCLGVVVGVWAKDSEDAHLVADLYILPMSFLGGTFVSVNKLPLLLHYFTWLLPLTPGSSLLRSLAEGRSLDWLSLLLLLGWLAIFFVLAQWVLEKARQE